MKFRVFFVFSKDPATFIYGSTSLVIEADKRPTTWEDMKPLYTHIKNTMFAPAALIFGLVEESEFQKHGARKTLYSQGNHRPVEGKSDDVC